MSKNLNVLDRSNVSASNNEVSKKTKSFQKHSRDVSKGKMKTRVWNNIWFFIDKFSWDISIIWYIFYLEISDTK